MSNTYLNSFNYNRRKEIPTPRLRALLSNPNVSVCESNVLSFDLNKGILPFYELNTSLLYKAEKSYLNLPKDYIMYFCLPATSKKIIIGQSCANNLDWLNRLFGLDSVSTKQMCLRYVGKVKSAKINHFCSIWDKSFHLLQSIIRVNSSQQYQLSDHQKEIFSLCWAKILAVSRIRMDLECSSDIQDMGVSVPLWLQQFSKGVVVLDTTSPMVSNSLISDMSTFLDGSYQDLKRISLSMCKSFLVEIKEKPEYRDHQEKIKEWIKLCDKMGSRSVIKKAAFSATVVFGIIGTIILLKKIKKAA